MSAVLVLLVLFIAVVESVTDKRNLSNDYTTGSGRLESTLR